MARGAFEPFAGGLEGGLEWGREKATGGLDFAALDDRGERGGCGSSFCLASAQPILKFRQDVLGGLEALPDAIFAIRVDGNDEFRCKAVGWGVGADDFLASIAVHFEPTFGSSAVFPSFHGFCFSTRLDI